MQDAQPTLALAFRAVALAMAVATIVLSALNTSTVATYVILLSVGLLALALASFVASPGTRGGGGRSAAAQRRRYR